VFPSHLLIFRRIRTVTFNSQGKTTLTNTLKAKDALTYFSEIASGTPGGPSAQLAKSEAVDDFMDYGGRMSFRRIEIVEPSQGVLVIVEKMNLLDAHDEVFSYITKLRQKNTPVFVAVRKGSSPLPVADEDTYKKALSSKHKFASIKVQEFSETSELKQNLLWLAEQSTLMKSSNSKSSRNNEIVF
jgi:hypothetical protein